MVEDREQPIFFMENPVCYPIVSQLGILFKELAGIYEWWFILKIDILKMEYVLKTSCCCFFITALRNTEDEQKLQYPQKKKNRAVIYHYLFLGILPTSIFLWSYQGLGVPKTIQLYPHDLGHILIMSVIDMVIQFAKLDIQMI